MPPRSAALDSYQRNVLGRTPKPGLARSSSGRSGLSSSTPALPYLEQPEVDSLLSQMGRQSLSTLETIGTGLDTPGAALRGALVGDPMSVFGEEQTGRTRVSGEDLLRHFGIVRDATDPYTKAIAGFATEVALDPLNMVFGPLSALGKAGKAARAANILDDAGEVAIKAMQRGGKALKPQLSRQGRRAYNRLVQKGVPLTDKNLAGFNVVGPRKARSQVTLDELVNMPGLKPEQVAKRRMAVEDYLGTKGLLRSPTTYDAVKDQTLGGSIGLGYFTPMATFSPKALDPAMESLDALGRFARYNPATRGMSALFDQRVGGSLSIPDQMAALSKYQRNSKDLAKSSVAAARHVEKLRAVRIPDEAKKILGTDDLLSKSGKNFLIRMHEGVGNTNDLRVAQLLGNDFRSYLASFDEIRKTNDILGQQLGLRPLEYQSSKYGYKFFPRFDDELDFGDYNKLAGGGEYNTLEGSMKPRQEYLETPGGTVDLIEASELKEVQELARGTGDEATIRRAGEAIRDFINQKHAPGSPTRNIQTNWKSQVIQRDPATGKFLREPTGALNDDQTLKMVRDPDTNELVPEFRFKRLNDPNVSIDTGQAIEIAGFLKRMKTNLPAGTGVYQTHPLQAIARNVVNQGRVRSNAAQIYGELAEDAVDLSFGPEAYKLSGANPEGFVDTKALGGGFKRLDKALDEIARDTQLLTNERGEAAEVVRENLRQGIRDLMGFAPSKEINLKRMAIRENTFNRVLKHKDFYANHKAQDEAISFFDQYTGIFKSLLLAFPSRHTRDMYSNALSVYLEVGNPYHAHWGFYVAKQLLNNNLAEADELLKQIPRYQRFVDSPMVEGGVKLSVSDSIRRQFVDDVAESGVLRTLASSDLVTSSPGSGKLNQLVPGSDPVSGYTEVLAPFFDPKRYTPEEFLSVRGMGFQGQQALETRNPLLGVSEKLSDYTDSVARLGGMLAMMKRGASPEYAAQRMTASLVDYSSLTPFERAIIKRFVFPWWSYNSRIGKYAVQSLIEKPGGGYAQMIRAMRVAQTPDEETYIPESLRQQFAVRIPEDVPMIGGALKYLGLGEGETTPFFKDLDVPGVDVLSLLSFKPTYDQSIQSTMQNVGLQTNPLLQTTAELITGRDLFTRRPLTESTAPVDRIYQKLGGQGNLPVMAKAIMDVIPTPRVAGILGGLADERLPMKQRIAKQLFNTFTGMKVQDVSPEWQLSEASRNLEDELSGFLTNHTTTYIPKDRMDNLPVNKLEDYLLLRTLQKQKRDLYKARND